VCIMFNYEFNVLIVINGDTCKTIFALRIRVLTSVVGTASLVSAGQLAGPI
jgi:hypothetical protein